MTYFLFGPMTKNHWMTSFNSVISLLGCVKPIGKIGEIGDLRQFTAREKFGWPPQFPRSHRGLILSARDPLRTTESLFCNKFSSHRNMKSSINFETHVSKDQVNFLDVQVSLHNGKLTTNMFSKPTDAHLYLNAKSCHPVHTINTLKEESICGRIVAFCGNKLLRFVKMNIFCGNKLLRFVKMNLFRGKTILRVDS